MSDVGDGESGEARGHERPANPTPHTTTSHTAGAAQFEFDYTSECGGCVDEPWWDMRE